MFVNVSDGKAIRTLGEGWTGDEVTAIPPVPSPATFQVPFTDIRHCTLEETLELSNLTLSTSCIIIECDRIDTPEKKRWHKRYCEMTHHAHRSVNWQKLQ